MTTMVKLGIFLTIVSVVLHQVPGSPSCHACSDCPTASTGATNWAQRHWAFLATVTTWNYTTPYAPTGYFNILIYSNTICTDVAPYQNKARLSTIEFDPRCNVSNAFSHLQENGKYYFFGKFIYFGTRRTYVVDRCAPPCNVTMTTCPPSLAQCVDIYGQ